MHNLQSQFPQILAMAKTKYGAVLKPRAILREYLQSMALAALYRLPKSQQLLFVGGTSLRLLRGIDRFSEDLDFDNLGLSNSEVSQLVRAVVDQFRHRDIKVELVTTTHQTHQYFELRFPELLSQLGISSNSKEKLMIKWDYSSLWQGQTPEVILFSRYGFLERVLTNPLSQLLVQKVAAYVKRRQTQPRDVYDIVWLYAQGARLDNTFIEENGLADIIPQAQAKLQAEGMPSSLNQRLAPFLFDNENLQRLSLFPDVLAALKTQSF